MTEQEYEKIRAKCLKMYDLTAAGNWAAVEEELTDDFKITEADSLPYGGTWEGKDALQRLYTHVFEFWEDGEIEFHDLLISPDNAIGLLTIHAKSRHTGQRMAMKVAEVFHLRGDKICGITPYYFDTVEVARATGALPQD